MCYFFSEQVFVKQLGHEWTHIYLNITKLKHLLGSLLSNVATWLDKNESCQISHRLQTSYRSTRNVRVYVAGLPFCIVI